MSNFVELVCPFCGEREFDDIGLKMHLLNGWCEPFEKVQPKSMQAPSPSTR